MARIITIVLSVIILFMALMIQVVSNDYQAVAGLLWLSIFIESLGYLYSHYRGNE